MNARLFFAAAIAALCASSAPAFDIVKDGKPNAVIVTAADPGSETQAAVQDFVYHVRLITGAELPVVAENAAPAAGNRICIGDSALTRELGIDVKTIPQEGFRILATKDVLAIVGEDSGKDWRARYAHCGTWYGVAHYFEKVHGVRWLWPGEEGIYFEKRATLPAGELDETRNPPLLLRRIRSFFTTERKIIQDPAVAGRIWPAVDYDLDKMAEEYVVWERRVRLGAAGTITSSHVLQRFYKTYYKDHPEYFAQQMDGTRNIPGSPDQCKLCVSNPDVARILIEDGRKYWKGQSRKSVPSYTYNIGFTDGNGYCWCDQCKALDAPDQKKRSYPTYLNEPATMEYVFLTDRYLTLWNKVAEALAKDYPDKYVGVLRYGACQPAPVREKVHPNIIIAAVTANDLRGTMDIVKVGQLQGWFDAGLRNFYWRPNLMYFDNFGMPYPYAERVTELLKYYIAHGMKGFDSDCWFGHFGSDGVNMYVITRVAWDPTLDAKELVREYCRKAYGKAGGAVERYLDLCVEVNGKMDKSYMRQGFFANGQKVFTPEILAQLDQIAREAQEASEADAAPFQKRMKVFQQAHQYTLLTGELLQALNAPKEPVESYYERLYKAVVARESFIERQGTSWAICTPALRYQEATSRIGAAADYGLYVKARSAALPAGTAPWRVALGAGALKMAARPAAIRVDGDDADWKDARFTAFVDNESNGAARAKTEAAVAYDAKALYICYRCEEPGEPLAIPRRRDSVLVCNNDSVQAFLDPARDGKAFYRFAVDVMNTTYEGRKPAEGDYTADWNGEWTAVVKRGERRWTVEIAIPWATLEVAPPKPGETWKFNLFRSRQNVKPTESQGLSATMAGYSGTKYCAELHFEQ